MTPFSFNNFSLSLCHREDRLGSLPSQKRFLHFPFPLFHKDAVTKKRRIMEKIIENPHEEWVDIVGYDGAYRVSSLGRVLSTERVVPRRGEGDKPIKERILRCWLRHGYKFVVLYKDRKQKNVSVHRLVAEAFIPNPNNLPCVNHKDENCLNNAASNLEWCDHKYNNNYGNHKKKLSIANGHPVVMLGDDGSVLATYHSASEAAREVGLPQTSISSCCRGEREKVGGYKWKYV